MDFKVRCIASCEPRHYTVGKVYQVEDGVFTTNAGLKLNKLRNATTLEDAVKALNNWCPGATKFELIPDRPRICEVLGNGKPLEVGEIFGYGSGKYFVKQVCADIYDVYEISTKGRTMDMLCEMIEHPDKIIRTPQFSEDEKALMRLYAGAGYTVFSRLVSGGLRAHGDCDSLIWLVLPEKLLPSLTNKNSPFNAKVYLEGLK